MFSVTKILIKKWITSNKQRANWQYYNLSNLNHSQFALKADSLHEHVELVRAKLHRFAFHPPKPKYLDQSVYVLQKVDYITFQYK